VETGKEDIGGESSRNDLSRDQGNSDRASAHQTRVATLVDRWLDDAISADEIAEMESMLLESSGARRTFWRRAGLHGLLHEAARIRFGGSVESPAEAAETVAASGGAIGNSRRGERAGRRRPSRFTAGWWRPGVLAACCLLLVGGGGLGSLVTSLATAHASRVAAEGSGAITVLAEGFESPPAPAEDYLPTTLDSWGGDETRVVGRGEWDANRMLPRSGQSMLRFVSGHPRGRDYAGVASEIWRFVDLDELRAIAGSKDIRVELSAWFNSVQPAEGCVPLCGLRAIATHLGPGDVKDTLWLDNGVLGDPDAAEERPSSMAAAESKDRLDADPASWQPLTVVLSLPAGSPRYLLVHCYALDRSAAAAAAADRLPGQYVDDISLTVEPADVSRTARAGRVERLRAPR
jgi:hypothetical protein